ncbi:transcriptional regulator UhpA [Xenorhabdus nematophila]|uniref:Transcriptional regulatory protein UhpA n=1 Tax=Xenorhabdus nematophila (strain ATCC 19061 / DSM 3370 / CCUG 14189 / LMG 1036 / NCIMB 9965 / AN6) TaxID=406817 RepID=D3VDT7_XENNA|nr:transcriptional regulator UhpA [Xenorhabdus nematophila]CEE94040.1 response regulator (activator) in two-component regulatory system wtih UhpB, regulates uhpT expression (LuxR/UhpA family) [Xenorhabdus nematophila str. Anatoliense]CEF32416.1 response regulator (activator) in two-component regulatory system wtih UhpB, regulates uhpT expression (LuxR/UhpA family) [Xenorhabdus nematophila str. Websteri]AYA42473.1 transcriptional regulator UhpA [Xenorhabdus nematophila]KHD27789.1 transcriptional
MIKVALVDDHVVVRSGFAQLLNLESDIEVVGEFSSCAEARQGLPGSGATVCILDISMKDESGLSLLQDLPSGITCIMLSVHDSATMVENALKAGARGYLSKRCSPDELLQAVRTTANNGCYLTPDIVHKLTSSKNNPTALDHLTKRERQVGEMLARGMDVKAVAAELGLSHKTVHVHRANAMSKLGVVNNVGLANYFATSGSSFN